MRFGLYYSGGLDWTAKPEPIANVADMFAAVPTDAAYRAYANAQVRELIARYRPSVLWNDIAWPHAEDLDPLFADYYAAVPDGVVNDRWFAMAPFFEGLREPAARAALNARIRARLESGGAMGTGPARGDFRTVEYGLGDIPADRKWEACRGVGLAFGYNSAERPEDFLDGPALVTLYRDVSARGGNLLINVGPRADGSIPEEQAAPLRALGAALRA
jgi:alpha-L-fucosidase